MSEQAKPMPLYARCNLDKKTVEAIVEWLRQEANIYRDCSTFSLSEQETRNHNAWLIDRMASSLSAHHAEAKQRARQSRARSRRKPSRKEPTNG